MKEILAAGFCMNWNRFCMWFKNVCLLTTSKNESPITRTALLEIAQLTSETNNFISCFNVFSENVNSQSDQKQSNIRLFEKSSFYVLFFYPRVSTS